MTPDAVEESRTREASGASDRDDTRAALKPRVSSLGPCAAWLFLTILICFVALTRGHFWTSDEIAVYQQARAVWEHDALAIDPQVNDAVPGRNGQFFARYGIGQSVLTLPLYGIGLNVHRLLDRVNAKSWELTFAGQVIAERGMRWGGDVDIFFVNLFNAIAVAGLVALFFAFNLRLGVSPKWSLIASLLLAFTAHIGGFAEGFYQHGAEALFLLWTFYFLFVDSVRPSPRVRVLAGSAAGAMVLVRVSAAVLLPALTLYLAWNLLKRYRNMARLATEAAAFLAPIAIAFILAGMVNYAKDGAFSIRGSYARLVPFNTPILVGLYGYLFSPGASMFLFTPLLVLAPWYLRAFARERRAEMLTILGIGLTYLFFYSGAYLWHGQWCFGPRYLVAVVPVLLLPLGGWLQRLRPAGWLAVVPLAALGLFIEILHVFVNVSYVYAREGYASFVPPYGFLFIPEASQVVAHWHALRAWDGRVDTWLIGIARMQGMGRFLLVAVVLSALLAICIRKLRDHIRRAQSTWTTNGAAPEFMTGISCEALRAVALVWLAAIVWILITRA